MIRLPSASEEPLFVFWPSCLFYKIVYFKTTFHTLFYFASFIPSTNKIILYI